jgi:uncharacterized membrane protein (DUF106 family)
MKPTMDERENKEAKHIMIFKHKFKLHTRRQIFQHTMQWLGLYCMCITISISMRKILKSNA